MIGRDSAARLTGAPEAMTDSGSRQSLARLEVPSFRSIYAQYFSFVWSSARRLGVRPAAMDDIVQEIFMVIHRKLDTLEQPQSLRSWIYGIVRRTVSAYHRSMRTRDASDTALALQIARQWETQLTPLELTEQNEEAKLLWQLLGEIEPPKREVLILVEIEGMTAPEISEALEIPLNTAYSRLRAARIAFEAALARQAARGEGGSGS
jgi:RNA polymerase sigma-70 factor (ECF subfamily)